MGEDSKNNDESDHLLSDNNFTKNDMSVVEWDDTQIIWDLAELEQINRERRKNSPELPQIEIIKKNSEVDLGLRAHTNFGFGKSLKSMFMPNCNEFIFIWLYIGFVVYFWVQSAFILLEDDSYGFKDPSSYKLMAAATITIAVSLTITLIYLIFYSMSERVNKTLYQFDLNIKYLQAFTLLVVTLCAEYAYSPYKVGQITLLEFLVYITLVFALVVIILVQFFQTIMWYVTFGYISVIVIADLVMCSNSSFNDFYVIFLIAVSLISVAGIFVFFQIPERWCKEARIFQLYFQSNVFYAVAYLMLLFVFQIGLYKLFKNNDELYELQINQAS